MRAGLAAAYADLGAGRYAAAQSKLQALVEAHRESWAAHHAFGAVLANVGLAREAEPLLRTALELDPGNARTRFALSACLLAQGRYAEGWPLFEARHELPGARPKPALPFPEWRGEPLAGKRLLVWPDEGLGDQIHFARFLPVVQARAAEVALVCSAPLERLFAMSFAGPVIALGPKVRYPSPDFWTTSGALAGLAGPWPQAAPPPPYLQAPPAAAPRGARIGVMTHGAPGHPNDVHRSLPAELAARLLALPGAISLDPGDTGVADFADTAAIIAGLELVISVDTSVAHLAGALGKPVWVLLARIGLDWRWGLEGETTAWYPSARLFRQRRIGDWAGVLDLVETELGRRS